MLRTVLVAVSLAGVAAAIVLYLLPQGSKPSFAPGVRVAPPLRPRVFTPIGIAPWKPPQEMPPPQERVKGGDWKDRFEAALRALPPLERDTELPAFGLRVEEVYREGQSRRLGVEVGDVIEGFNGKPALGESAFSILRAMSPGTVRLASPSKGVRDVEYGEGSIGAKWAFEWRPELAFLRSKESDPRWDSFVRVACATWLTEDDLAETALHHARAAGCTSWVIPALMARLAHENARHPEALAYAWFAKEIMPAAGRGPILTAFIQSALLIGQTDWALKMAEAHAEYFPLHMGSKAVRTISRYAAAADASADGSTPCLLAAGGKAPLKALEGLDDHGRSISGQMSRGTTSPFALRHGEGLAAVLGPPVRDPAFSIDLEMKAAPGKAEGRSLIRFTLLNVSGGVDEPLARLELGTDGRLEVFASGRPTLTLTGRSLFPADGQSLDLALKGPWCEIRLNGRCVLLACVADSPDRKVACAVELWCVTGEFKRVELRDLNDGRESAAVPVRPPPPQSDLKAPPAPKEPELSWPYEAMVEGYLRHGSRSAAWDEAALAALTLGARFWAYPSERTDVHRVCEASRKAFDSGCDDPLVLWVHATASVMLQGSMDEELVRRFRKATPRLRETGYSPSLRAFLLLHNIIDWSEFGSHRDPELVRQTVEQALALLPAAASEKGVPPRLLVNLLRSVRKGLSGRSENPLPVFEKVWAEGERARIPPAALLVFKGEFFKEYAWMARGGGWASTVSEDGWKLFRERLQTAAEAYTESWKLDPSTPYAATSMLTVALGHEPTRGEFPIWLERAWSADPNHADAGEAALQFLMPRWFGSHMKLLQFGRACFAKAKAESLQPRMALLLLVAHDRVAQDADSRDVSAQERAWRVQEYWRKPACWAEVKSVFDWLLAKYPDSIYYRSLYASYACRCGRWREAADEFERLGDALAEGAFLDRGEIPLLRAVARTRKK